MAVYDGDKADHLAEAIESVFAQTLSPSELVVVIDGPISAALEDTIGRFSRHVPMNIVRISANCGLGAALSRGLLNCENEFVARMDADDICVPNRFEVQAKAFINDPGLDISGGCVSEFSVSPHLSTALRCPPISHKGIVCWSKLRNPFNHMTVMYKKSTVLRAGNYSPAFRYFEDYELWARLILAGARCGNVRDILVHARAGNAMLDRRRGVFYARQELRFALHLFRLGFISSWYFLVWAFVRVPLRLFPQSILFWIYRLLRIKNF